jgi:hypothetical protein
MLLTNLLGREVKFLPDPEKAILSTGCVHAVTSDGITFRFLIADSYGDFHSVRQAQVSLLKETNEPTVPH